MTESTKLDGLAASLAKLTSAYLSDEMGVDVTECRKASTGEASLTLDRMTAIIGAGGTSGLLAAFSFSPELADHLYQRTASILSIPPEEEEAFRHGILVETANVIIGNWLPHYLPPGETADMTPPSMLGSAKRIPRMAEAMFASVAMATKQGGLRIFLIRPRSLFENDLIAA